MSEPDLRFEMSCDNYAWPNGTTISRETGESLNLTPYAAATPVQNLLDHSVAGSCFQYKCDGEIYSELDALIWCEGRSFATDVAEIIGVAFDRFNAEQLTADFIVRELQIYGLSDIAISLNLKWMVQSCQLTMSVTNGHQYFSLIR